MKISFRSTVRLRGTADILTALSGGVSASLSYAQPIRFSPSELGELVARIVLFPDPLLAQLLWPTHTVCDRSSLGHRLGRSRIRRALLFRSLNSQALREPELTTVPSRNVLIAATQHTLRKTVAEGRFRDALFYRLNVFPITVPPLRARADDLPLLVRHFVTQNGWARRSTACRRKRSLLLRFMRGAAPVTLKDAERLRISRALREVNGVIAALAAPAVQLGLPPSTPFYKMRRLGISASGREQHARSESLSVL